MCARACVRGAPGPQGYAWMKGVGVCVCVCVTSSQAPALARAGGDRVLRVGGINTATVGTGRGHGGPTRTHGASFGAAGEEEHKILRDNYQDGVCSRTQFGCQQAPALFPPSHIWSDKRGVWRWPCTQPHKRNPSSPPVLEHPDSRPGLSLLLTIPHLRVPGSTQGCEGGREWLYPPFQPSSPRHGMLGGE